MPFSIRVKCGNCKRHFNFEHPSIRRVEDLMKIHIRCPKCKAYLEAPTDAIRMEPITLLIKA